VKEKRPSRLLMADLVKMKNSHSKWNGKVTSLAKFREQKSCSEESFARDDR